MSTTVVHQAVALTGLTGAEIQAAAEVAATALNATVLPYAAHQMFDRQAEGIGVKIPTWRYPIVCQDNGELASDLYHGRWGKQAELDTFTDRYRTALLQNRTVAQLRAQCDREGYKIAKDTTLADGTRELRIRVNAEDGGEGELCGAGVDGGGGLTVG